MLKPVHNLRHCWHWHSWCQGPSWSLFSCRSCGWPPGVCFGICLGLFLVRGASWEKGMSWILRNRKCKKSKIFLALFIHSSGFLSSIALGEIQMANRIDQTASSPQEKGHTNRNYKTSGNWGASKWALLKFRESFDDLSSLLNSLSGSPWEKKTLKILPSIHKVYISILVSKFDELFCFPKKCPSTVLRFFVWWEFYVW